MIKKSPIIDYETQINDIEDKRLYHYTSFCDESCVDEDRIYHSIEKIIADIVEASRRKDILYIYFFERRKENPEWIHVSRISIDYSLGKNVEITGHHTCIGIIKCFNFFGRIEICPDFPAPFIAIHSGTLENEKKDE